MNKLLITIFFLFNNLLFSQSFEVPDDYIEAPLIFSHETVLKGISSIIPVGDIFSKYSKIELSSLKNKIADPNLWLNDKMYDELGNIAETERILRSKDSPLSDPIFDQFKHLPMFVDDTIQQLASNPLVFCNEITRQYNKQGLFFELNCTVPFGFFNKYLILRLQLKDKLWYFTRITSLSYFRIKEMISIAESFYIKNENSQ